MLIKTNNFIIKKATEEDIYDVFELSNDKDVRENSINTSKIEFPSHQKWFLSKISNPKDYFYIIKTHNDDFIGQLRIENKNNENIISISIKKEFRNRKIASKIINQCSILSDLSKITAYIKPSNIPSIKAFERAGYKFDKEVILENDIELLKFIFLQ